MDKINDISCPNCGRKNLIIRVWRDDIVCGWCLQEYVIKDDKLVITLIGKQQPAQDATKK